QPAPIAVRIGGHGPPSVSLALPSTMIAMKTILLWLLPIAVLAQVPVTHFNNIRQLTSGGSNGESYWSPDSKRIIFQSTRDGRERDQEYIMNADGSNQHMV